MTEQKAAALATTMEIAAQMPATRSRTGLPHVVVVSRDGAAGGGGGGGGGGGRRRRPCRPCRCRPCHHSFVVLVAET